MAQHFKLSSQVMMVQVPELELPTQTGILKTFFEDMTAGGALPFDWVHPREGTAAEFRFVEAPRVSAVTGTLFSVAVKLEQMP